MLHTGDGIIPDDFFGGIGSFGRKENVLLKESGGLGDVEAASFVQGFALLFCQMSRKKSK